MGLLVSYAVTRYYIRRFSFVHFALSEPDRLIIDEIAIELVSQATSVLYSYRK